MVAWLVNSADSHVLEPVDLWQRELPPSMRDRGPVTETADDREIVYVDGVVVRRDPVAFMEAIRPRGAHDPAARLADLADIFDGVPDAIRDGITVGNFARLFTVPEPVAA